MKIPFIRPQPPRLSSLTAELSQLETSNRFTNFGPFEREFCRRMNTEYFGAGSTATVCNATLGLILAVRQALLRATWGEQERRRRRFAVMPSFSFAALAHAALWNGLTPWFVDVDPETWLPSANAEREVLDEHHHEVAVMLPAATFGNSLDLDRYAALSERFNVPVVVDAAASIGCLDERGRPFGAGSRFAIVFSMHATKPFATAEGGLVHSADAQLVDDIRQMSNFGFDADRQALLPGLNAKLSEIGALLCLRKLDEIEAVAEHRSQLAGDYARLLPALGHQKRTSRRLPYQFYPAVLPGPPVDRGRVLDALLSAHEVEAAHYFSPHLAEQPFFCASSAPAPLHVTCDISARIVSLPVHDTFTGDDVAYVAGAVRSACADVQALGQPT